MSNTDILTGAPMGEGIAPQAAPAKRTMTPEHKARMAAGRARAKESRGRPASRPEAAPMPAERPRDTQTDQSLEFDYSEYEQLAGSLTRQSRVNGDNTFDIPLTGRMPGWDYQWNPTHVMGQEVDASEQVNYQMGGWVPVKPAMFPTLCPSGWSRPTIDRQGQRLFMRPMRLTQEALAEQTALAYEQKQAKLAQAAAGESGREFAPRRNDGVSVQVRPLLE